MEAVSRAFLSTSRHPDDLPEDLADRFHRQTSVPCSLRHPADDGGFARRVQDRKTRGAFQLAGALAEHHAAPEQDDDFIIQPFDLVPACGELGERVASRLAAHATAL